MAYFICEKQGRCCPHEFYDSIEQAITDSEDGVPCDHLIEVAPVRKGRWESVGLSSLKCSDCGYLDDMKMYHRYCPDCGCFMR